MKTTTHLQHTFANRKVDPQVLQMNREKLQRRVRKTTPENPAPIQVPVSELKFIPVKKAARTSPAEETNQSRPVTQEQLPALPDSIVPEYELSSLGKWLVNLPVVKKVLDIIGNLKKSS